MGLSDFLSGVDRSMSDLKRDVGAILDGYALEAVSPETLEAVLSLIGKRITESSSEPAKEVQVSAKLLY